MAFPNETGWGIGDTIGRHGTSPKTAHRALATHILVVATTRIEGTWKAYVGVVDGKNHEREAAGVLQRGTALDETLARTVFRNYPEFLELPYAG